MNYNGMKKAELIERIKQLETQSTPMAPSLQVSSCQMYPFDASSSELKALATILINDAIQIRNLGIKESPNGLYVEYPPDPLHKGIVGRSVCGPITRELRDHIEAVVLAKYQQSISMEAVNG